MGLCLLVNTARAVSVLQEIEGSTGEEDGYGRLCGEGLGMRGVSSSEVVCRS